MVNLCKTEVTVVVPVEAAVVVSNHTSSLQTVTAGNLESYIVTLKCNTDNDTDIPTFNSAINAVHAPTHL